MNIIVFSNENSAIYLLPREQKAIGLLERMLFHRRHYASIVFFLNPIESWFAVSINDYSSQLYSFCSASASRSCAYAATATTASSNAETVEIFAKNVRVENAGEHTESSTTNR